MPDIKFQYRKQEFSNKTNKNLQKRTNPAKLSNFEIENFKIQNLKEHFYEFSDSSNLKNLTSDFSSSLQIASTMFNGLTDFNSTTIEIDSKDHFDLQKDNNHLIEFNRLECIFDFCNPRNTITVKLKKGLRGLGISLGGGRIPDEQLNEESNQNFSLINQLIRVKKLYQAHPASECGLIDENDFILDVNDHCFVGLTYIEAFNILHSVQDEVTLRIFKFSQCPLELQKYLLPKEENSSFESSLSEFSRELNIFESTRITDLDDEQQSNQSIQRPNYRIHKVTLIKKDGSLGFTLSKIENEGFYVKQVLREPACLEQINPGDRIVSVNGTSLDGLDLNDAIKFLRSLPDLCEFKLEQICESPVNNFEDNTDNSLNYQSETEDNDNRFKKKQLRHEVKIMLDSRNKDPLNNRLKRKDLKKSTKDDSKSELKNERKNLESSKFIDSGFINGLDSELNDSKFEDKSSFKDNLIDCNLESKLDKENQTAFIKVNKKLINDSSFFRQSSVIDFSRTEYKNLQSNMNDKQNNLNNKWRYAILNGDDKEDEDTFDLNLNSAFKKTHLKELNDEDSDFGDDSMLNRTNDQTNNQVNRTVNQIDNFQCKQDLIRLSDIQLNLNNDCFLNENSMYNKIENALFFYITLDRIGWYGRLGLGLTDDQVNDFRVVNTLKHGFSACIVKEIYPNSLAYTDGRIKVGDKLLEVNNQQLINKPVQTVIRDLRKLKKSKLRLLLIRKVF